MLLTQVALQQQQLKVTSKTNPQYPTKSCPIHSEAISPVDDKRVVSTSSCYFKEAFRKINARWIPHLLTDEQKRTRVANAKKKKKKKKKLLKMYPNYSKKAFDNLVTGDET